MERIDFKEGCVQDFDGAQKQERVFFDTARSIKTILNSLNKHLRMRRNDLQPWRPWLTGLICSVSEFKLVRSEGLAMHNIYTTPIQRYVYIKVSVMLPIYLLRYSVIVIRTYEKLHMSQRKRLPCRQNM